jgi:hypothetical protein
MGMAMGHLLKSATLSGRARMRRTEDFSTRRSQLERPELDTPE